MVFFFLAEDGIRCYDVTGVQTGALPISATGCSRAFSIAGGGDTWAAVERYNVKSQISYLSTGGGAFLEFLEGRQLHAVAILEERAAH